MSIITNRGVQVSAAAGATLAATSVVTPLPWALWAAWTALSLIAVAKSFRG
ncbi:hypothetical protein Back2_17720 [Nocardioides baekrokdamisoli]|uniref:Uncharacterized protein n=1 Tax=Nocardioides baekrokdamisoli TaxID=1804624 RepID=A0A3G9IN79_9ACTN|nr:hypothetical protein [Nocardioides baekrokdamisoli]BBH17485.1 hypothetical protein Back2_17720 [Nocardioides baekrokdamisoli]